MAARSQFASHVGGHLPSLPINVAQQAGEHYIDSNDVQARLRARDAVFSDPRDVS
jgi:hypothetical protein